MLGMLGLLILDAKKLSDYVKEHVQLNVFLRDNLSEQELNGFIKSVNDLPFVRFSKYVSKEEALDSLRKDLGEEALSMIESNPLPASLDVYLLADYAQSDSLLKIKDLISGYAPVTEVVYQQNEIEKMSANFRTIAMIILLFSGLLLFIAIVLINNTIRLSLYSKRFLIKSMQLVGATKGFIRWPFLKRGLLHGFIAGMISILLLSGIIYLIQKRFPGFDQLSDLTLLGILMAGIIVFGFLISGLSTFFAVNRYLRKSVEGMY
jgi:cell division transport system permease protein